MAATNVTEKLARGLITGCSKDAVHGTPLTMPLPHAPPFHPIRMWLLSVGGVKISQDGKCVFNYNPGTLTAGLRFLAVICAVPSMYNLAFYGQCVIMIVSAVIVHMVAHGLWSEMELNIWRQDLMEKCESLAGLTRFVLGMYVSLLLAKTYYANRSFFGTVFGSTMGFCQMVAAWVRPPDDRYDSWHSAMAAQALLVRWVNAAYRLLVLEVRTDPPNSPEQIGEEMLDRNLLTDSEWNCIKSVPSRASHIYQWVNNVLLDLVRAGYIRDTKLLQVMHRQIDDMRGANVWGLPSLPLPYTLIITVMVKFYLFCVTLEAGLRGSQSNDVWAIIWLILQHFLYQGLLDLHGALYNPNGGEFLGHLPAENFLDFVQTVTTDMLNVSGNNAGEALPYTLHLARKNVTESEQIDMFNMLGGF